MKKLSFFLLISLTLMVSCKQNTAQLDRLFSGMFPPDEPGAAVLILKGDDILFDKGYGVADLETKKPIDGNTFFNIASVSKQFTAVAILQLAEAGKLSLEDPVAMYFPFEQKCGSSISSPIPPAYRMPAAAFPASSRSRATKPWRFPISRM